MSDLVLDTCDGGYGNLILDTFNNGYLNIESVVDFDDELRLEAKEVGDCTAVIYINKEHAEEIIGHLSKVFDLGIAITSD